MIVDRRDFVTLTLGGASAAAVTGAGAAPDRPPAASAQAGGTTPATPTWRDVLIINALGDLDDPNPPSGSDKSAQRAAVQGTESLVLNKRAISDALASGLTAVNVTLGYVAGDME